VEEAILEDQERCIRRPVQTVIRKLKYPSSHQAIDLSTAENATRTINQRDINISSIAYINS